jgi:Outer membrane protein beta-barrel domain
MKNKYIALIVAMLTAVTTHAGNTNTITLDKPEPVEYYTQVHWVGMSQRSKTDGQWDKYMWNDSAQLSVGADFCKGWNVELETGESRNEGSNQQTTGYVEGKVRYTFPIAKKWDFGVRGGLGVGYSYTDPSVPQAAYWLTQFRLRYHITDKLSTWVRYEPGSLLNANYGDTFVNNFKIALEYQLAKHIEIGVRYINAFGQNYQGQGTETTLQFDF